MTLKIQKYLFLAFFVVWSFLMLVFITSCGPLYKPVSDINESLGVDDDHHIEELIEDGLELFDIKADLTGSSPE